MTPEASENAYAHSQEETAWGQGDNHRQAAKQFSEFSTDQSAVKDFTIQGVSDRIFWKASLQ